MLHDLGVQLILRQIRYVIITISGPGALMSPMYGGGLSVLCAKQPAYCYAFL